MMTGLLLSLAVSARTLRSWLASMLLACGLLLAGVLSATAVAAPPELKPQSASPHSEHTPPGAVVSAEAPGHTRIPKSIYHIPKYRSTVGVFNSPFASPTIEGGVHNHHGPICEKYSGSECAKYYEGKLYYRGGEVLKEPKLYLIFYGSNWTKNEENKKWKGALLNTLRGMTTEYAFDETYQRILHQYWDEQTEPKQISNTMTVGGEWVYEGAEAPQNLTEENVELEVNQAIETNHWTRAKNAVFMVMEPIGSAWNEKFAEETQCGYHYTDRWGDVYALIPNDNDRHFNSGCVINSIQRTETETATHEYAEAVTDPHPREGETPGWTNNQGYEIADICDAEPEMLNETLGIYVSALWGNTEKTCVIHDPPENPPSSPTSTTEGTSSVSFHQATLTGSVNPNGGPEPRYYFEYGTTTGYGSYVPAPPGLGLGSRGESPVPVNVTPTGLKVGTTYHYRLVASTWAGTGYGADKEFTTLIPPPIATTESAIEIGEKQATLNATVNPEEASTTYQFEYWLLNKPTEITKVPASPQSVGSGTGNVHVSQRLETLTAVSEYGYRVVASSAGGTTYGKEVTFRTAPFAVTHPSANPSGAEWAAVSGMSCNSASACIAVGGAHVSKLTVPLAESWNGNEWKLVSPSLPSGAKEASVESVSCTSATACTAVGKDTTTEGNLFVLGRSEAFVERWNGSTWSVQPTPPAPSKHAYELYGVSCTSSTACIAVGATVTETAEVVPLAESWNGSEWKVVTAAGTTGMLRGLSCTSSAACTAVGTTTLVAGEPMIERWNGNEWKTEEPAKIAGGATLTSVSCASSTSCVAVGYHGGAFGSPASNVSETWNGTAWSTASVPLPPGAKESSLRGVTCSSSSSCIAVGLEGEVIGKHSALADLWTGSEWRIMSVVAPAGTKTSALSSVSCTTTLCTTGGTEEASNGQEGTFVAVSGSPFAQTEAASNVEAGTATLNGNIEPNGRNTTYHFEYGQTEAYGTSVPTTNAAVKALSGSEHVSAALSGLNPQTTYHYRVVTTNLSGTTVGADKTFTTTSPPWTTDSTPNPSGAEWVSINGMSCNSTSACMAVGEAHISKVTVPLAESWNGSEWTLVSPSLPSGAKEAGFYAVACTSATACTVVGRDISTSEGFLGVEGRSEVLVERWNGSIWNVQSTPAPPSKDAYELRGVTCTGSAACTAVGANITGALEWVPLMESWNGSEWKVISTPVSKGQLNAISCSSSTACMAVGNSGYAGNPMAEQWNGTEWTTSTPAKYSAGASLSGVACPSSTACVAVGWSGGYLFGPADTNVSETWNGTTWTTVTVPAPNGAKESLLRSVACGTSTWCVAVGLQGELIGNHTGLADIWNGKEWQITSLPLPTGTTNWGGISCAGIYCHAGGSNEAKVLIDSN